MGVERIVFGSDFPFFRVEDELAKVRALDISDDEREALLSGNALSRVLPAGSRPEHTPDADDRSPEVF